MTASQIIKFYASENNVTLHEAAEALGIAPYERSLNSYRTL